MRRYVPILGQELRKLHATCHNDERHCRERTGAGAEKKEWNGIGAKHAVWFTVQECIEIRLKSARGGGWLRGGAETAVFELLCEIFTRPIGRQ
ncbi:hypothetical protein TNCV_4838211 [Trichonephila clavipes]|nr:hypothetical protein TNCV_4838211 [Trichonephila clavipes]